MKKILLLILSFLILLFNFVFVLAAPNFENMINGKKLTLHGLQPEVKGTILYDPSNIWISNTDDLLTNIESIFFPSSAGNGGKLWTILRVIGVWIWILFLIRAWALFVLNADMNLNFQKLRLI